MNERANVFTIHSAGVSYNDWVTQVNEELEDLMTRYRLVPKEKYSVGNGPGQVDIKTFSTILEAVKRTVKSTHGGSSGNILCTIQRMLGDCVRTSYQTVIDERSGHVIGKSFKNAGVTVIPPKQTHALESGDSIVIRVPGGERTIITNDGNARNVLCKEFLDDSHIRDSDITFLEGSLWQKLGADTSDALATWRWNHAKTLCLALPTKMEFAYQNADRFRFLIPSTNVVLGNLDELSYIYGVDKASAPGELMKQFQSSILKPSPHDPIYRDPTGFITDDKNGFYYITRDGYELVRGTPNEYLNIVNRLGAGDTALAGALVGALVGLPNNQCCELGNTLAEAKICDHDGAQLLQPLEALKIKPGLFFDFMTAFNDKYLRPKLLRPTHNPASELTLEFA